MPISYTTISALSQAITGGSGNGSGAGVGTYRSAWHLERFFTEEGLSFSLNSRARVPAITEFLHDLASTPDGIEVFKRLIVKSCDPRNFIGDNEGLQKLVEYLNNHLAFDDLMVAREGRNIQVLSISSLSDVAGELSNRQLPLSFSAVKEEVARGLATAETDPPAAITAACVLIESVCRSILFELQIDPPSKRDIEGLLRAVQVPLKLSPSRTDLPDLIANDIRQVLGGLTSVAKGVGALRSHGGTAHARAVGQPPVDARIARFAINSASTIAIFLVETWLKNNEPRNIG